MRVHAGRRRAPPPSARSGKKFQRLQKEKEVTSSLQKYEPFLVQSKNFP